MKTIFLSESEIESIINGKEIVVTLGTDKITVRQSYMRDLIKPMLDNPKKVVDTSVNEIVNKDFLGNMRNHFFENTFRN